MDHSRSPRCYHNAGGQVSCYPPLSDEARFLQRLAEPELPPGATDAERAAATADAAAGGEHAASELGEHWAKAYQELRPDWQPAPTDIEISNQRAAELTAAREQIARLTASISVLRTHITRLEAGNAELTDALRDAYLTWNDFDLSSDEVRRRVLLFLHGMSTQYGWGWAAPPQQPTTPPTRTRQPAPVTPPPVPRPFTGQGRRLDE